MLEIEFGIEYYKLIVMAKSDMFVVSSQQCPLIEIIQNSEGKKVTESGGTPRSTVICIITVVFYIFKSLLVYYCGIYSYSLIT